MDNQITGNIGLYWTCFSLSRMGWNVLPTSRNARGIDAIAHNDDCGRMVSLQVKTLQRRNAVPLGSSLEKVMGDYWVIVINGSPVPQAYILTAMEVKELANRNERDGRVSYWLEKTDYQNDEYSEAWGRIGKI